MYKTFRHVSVHKRQFQKVFVYVFIGLIFGIVYAIIEKGLLGPLNYYPATGNPYDGFENSISTVLQAGILGGIMGVIEVLLLDKIFSRKSFAIKFLSKSVIYVAVILICVVIFSMVSTSMISEVPLFHPIVYHRLILFFTDAGFWSILLYTGCIFSIAVFYSEMSDLLGQNVLSNFLLGKYHNPRSEERVFMFMDIKSSTSVAEKLGHVKYFRFLHDYYEDITAAIMETRGEIYQYVGDEIIISWKENEGILDNNCLRCFFLCKSLILLHSEKYIKNFGIVPEFKIGLHHGNVATGRVGIVKKEIIYTGDVLNTASRIQDICNSYQVDNLISDQLLSRLQLPLDYSSSEIGEIKLRGKENSVKLYTIIIDESTKHSAVTLN